MPINRIAAQRLISEIPQKLRNAARAERKIIINETKKDPVGTSIRAASGQFDFTNNVELQTKVQHLKNKMAVEAYEKKQNSQTFIHRQPQGNVVQCYTNTPKVIHASMVLD